MNLEQVLNAPLIYQLATDYWAAKEKGKGAALELECLNDLGINEKLLSELKKIEALFHYNHAFQCNREYYSLLRDGLSQYYNKEIRSRFWEALKIENKKIHLCDLGAGAGQYSNDFLSLNPESLVTLVDRTGVMSHDLSKQDPRMAHFEVDWEENGEWWGNFINTFDVVLMSEILHQKSSDDRDNLVMAAKMISKPNGKIVVHESNDPFLAFRLHQLTMDGDRMNIQDVRDVMTRNNLRSADIHFNTARYHHVSTWRIIK